MSSARYKFELWGSDQLTDCRAQWQELLSRSDASNLFMSWDWQILWWEVHRRPFSLQQTVVAVYEGSRLMALAPFTVRSVSHRGIFTTTRLELSGHLWRQPTAVISEYLDLIVDNSCESDLIDQIGVFVRNEIEFDEIVVANTRPGSNASKLLDALLTDSPGGYIRSSDFLFDHTIDLRTGIDAYVKSLSSDVRRRMFNHRERLEDPMLIFFDKAEVAAAFTSMDSYLESRWGKRQFVGLKDDFHRQFACRMASTGALRFSMLRVSGVPLSFMYNIRLGENEYNIQSAFSPEHAVGLTPTYLHYGYCIEDAQTHGVTEMHLLAGQGKSRNYKRDIASPVGSIRSKQYLAGRIASWSYRAYDRVRRSANGEQEDD